MSIKKTYLILLIMIFSYQDSIAQNRRPAQARQRNLEMERSRAEIPQSAQPPAARRQVRRIERVAPPSNREIYDTSSLEGNYERLVDEEIQALYQLMRSNRRSANRGEIWLRLGERYVEKARLVMFRDQERYEQQVAAFNEGRLRNQPRLNLAEARSFNRKAIELYEWFIRDFPNHPKVDQALFFLGYNHYEIERPADGQRYYGRLVQQFPRSPFVPEAHFAIAEFHFENERWPQALQSYSRVIENRRARLFNFALYKMAWCLHRMGRHREALGRLRQVIQMGKVADARESLGVSLGVDNTRLHSEAVRDYIMFFAEAGDPRQAVNDFQRVASNREHAIEMIERLAYTYSDTGRSQEAASLFRHLISLNPSDMKSAEYQYQIVSGVREGRPDEFLRQIDVWLGTFGPSSRFSEVNKSKGNELSEIFALQETTIRNAALQSHQTARKTRNPQARALTARYYQIYLRYFLNKEHGPQILFFYADLLYDMEEFERSAQIYIRSAEHEKTGELKEKALSNAILSLEKLLPSEADLDRRRGNTVSPMSLSPIVALFARTSLSYLEAFPKGTKARAVRRNIGVILYNHNHFDQANEIFEDLLKENPASPEGQIAGNLLMDSFKLRDDMPGLRKKGQELLQDPRLVRTEFGRELQKLVETAGFLSAEEMAEGGKALESAKDFETFAQENPRSLLGQIARYRAAVNYEQGGAIGDAIRMYQATLSLSSQDPQIREAQDDSRSALARLYQKIGLLDQAARLYFEYGSSQGRSEKAADAFYNAAVLWDAVGNDQDAIQAYQRYYTTADRRDKQEVLFFQAEIYRRKGNRGRAINLYQEFLGSGVGGAQALRAQFYIAELNREAGAQGASKQAYNQVLQRFRSLTGGHRDAVTGYAAKARFQLAQEILQEIARVRFTDREEQQGEAAARINDHQNTYIEAMAEVIQFDYGPYIVAALSSTGSMFETIADVFSRIPVPRGFNETEAEQYRELIGEQSKAFLKEAESSYQSAAQRAKELGVYTSWSLMATERLKGLNKEDRNVSPQFYSPSTLVDWFEL